jgi:hypothetical protein
MSPGVNMLSSVTNAMDSGPSNKLSEKHEKIKRVIARTVACVGLLALAIICILVILIFHKMPPPSARRDSDAARRPAMEAHATGAAGGPRILRIDETEVNAVFDTQLASVRNKRHLTGSDHGPSPEQTSTSVRDLKVKMSDDRLYVYLLMGIQGKDVTIDLEGKLHSKDGHMLFEPLSGEIGALPVPQFVLARVIQIIMNSPEYRESLRLPPGISDLKVENGHFVVAYR